MKQFTIAFIWTAFLIAALESCTSKTAILECAKETGSSLSARAIADSIDYYKAQAWKFLNSSPEASFAQARHLKRFAGEHGQDEAVALGLNLIGIYYKNKAEYHKAYENYVASLHIRAQLRKPVLVAKSLNNIGTLYRKLKSFPLAKDYYFTALWILGQENQSDPDIQKLKAQLYGGLGTCYKYLSLYDKSQRCYHKSKEINSKWSLKLGLARNYNDLGALYELQGNFKQAKQAYLISHSLHLEIPNFRGAAKVILNLGNLYQVKNELDSALVLYHESLAMMQELGAVQEIALLRRNIGLIFQRQGRQDQAITQFQLAANYYDSTECESNLALVLNDLGSSARLNGEYPQAIFYFKSSLENMDSLSDWREQINILTNLSNTYTLLEKFDRAYQADTQIEKIYELQQDQSAQTGYQLAYQKASVKAEKQKRKNLELAGTLKLVFIISLFGALLILLLLWVNANSKKRAAEARERATAFQQKALETNHELLLSQQRELEKQQRVEELIQTQEITVLEASLQAQRDERDRIARDLHDRLGGSIATNILHFQGVLAESQPIDPQKIELGIDKLKISIQDLRRIIKGLKPISLEEKGLHKAIEEMIRSANRSPHIAVDFFAHGLDHRLPAQLEKDIYFIINELLSNALKHSEADHITIQALKNANSLDIMAEDNGQGFNLERLGSDQGIGLESIHYRSRKHAGQFWMDSIPGRGSTFCINIPIN